MVAESLISVSGLQRRPVRDSQGADIGRLADVVVQAAEEDYPAVAGLVVRVGFRRVFIHVQHVAAITQREVRLSSTRVDLRDYARRAGEMLLVHDVLDHQLVDVDGVRVVRASDVYLTPAGGLHRLVGVDVSVISLLRRVLPGAVGRRPTPELVLDWASVRPFGRAGGLVELRRPQASLHELRPAELADLLEDLGRHQRRELLTALEAETAADAMEEMEAGELVALLRDLPRSQAADLLSRMEPDEAVEALRDLTEDERDGLLTAMPRLSAETLQKLISYPQERAGGWMTTNLVLVAPSDSVAAAREKVTAWHAHSDDIDGVVVVDADGRLVDHVRLFDLLVARPDQRMEELVGPPWPATVTPDADLPAVVERLIANRGSSLLVIDDGERPLGRILADDVVDVLATSRSRHWPWQPQRQVG